ncbi:plasmid mobilization protein [Butyrivibrio sp. INlla14]|uniref:plasmid mobilization protein n=1 Tax=Butyrivibrio sp. INlla14 TaxID=1520808 RepID=UPI000877113B|nr:plasmid mobilization relaxosome protein MobC [Butyrivibrio sp. INlla14]SCX84616.1 mobilisation protein (MobC) [Butyrivibrio sp. INlla14]
MREYTDYIRIKLKKGEREKILKRMEEAGINNMSAYIRKMAIDGYVIRLDLSDVKEVSRLLRINANNINQCAKRANETGSFYYGEIQRIQVQQEQLWSLLKAILQRLSTI